MRTTECSARRLWGGKRYTGAGNPAPFAKHPYRPRSQSVTSQPKYHNYSIAPLAPRSCGPRSEGTTIELHTRARPTDLPSYRKIYRAVNSRDFSMEPLAPFPLVPFLLL